MPNICFYSMCVIGKKESVEEFIKVIKADYDYGTMEFTHDRHLFRVFEAYENNIEHIGQNVQGDDLYEVIINGECAWSVGCCMFDDGYHGYYADFKKRFPNDFRGTTIPIESKNLELSIEIFSEESGMCFQEHYMVVDGDVIVDECVDWDEYYIRDYATKEEAEEDLGIEITDEEWNGPDDYISRGGFGSWDFEI